MKLKVFVLVLGLVAIPGIVHAWWNDAWSSRKQISLDGGATGADVQETLSEFPVLVRLHTGNFGYFMDLAENGKDIRFMADDKTPLKYHVEKFDAINEMALIWVKAPQFRGGISTDSIWMYYGNAEAPDGGDANGTYDVHQALVLHFDETDPMPKDATAYGNHAADSKAAPEPAGWIGAAAKFTGAGGITINANPALQLSPDKGWTFSAWLKIDQAQSNAYVLHAAEGENALELSVRDTGLVAKYANNGQGGETPPAPLQLGKWQHIAVVLRTDKLELYLDGNKAGESPASAGPMNPMVTLGAGAAGDSLIGFLDEVQIANTARSADWIKLLARSQSADFNVLGFGQDESKQGAGGPNYFVIILQSLTVDGWVVIALCGVMFVISALVMVTKGLAISRANRDNRAFLDQYRNMDASADPGALDQEETEEEKELSESEFLAAVVGKHDHFQSSPVYHVYHAGVQELKKRFGTLANQPLTDEALNVLRARLDAAVVREGQKLNRNMVLLTIAISGGPFLGLLGTVLGVMITFAVIAATGDVNINSIAPGISGALLATVAGLAVAIPALFGYNYLLTQIKDLTAEMRVFTDEFLAMVSERLAERHRGG